MPYCCSSSAHLRHTSYGSAHSIVEPGPSSRSVATNCNLVDCRPHSVFLHRGLAPREVDQPIIISCSSIARGPIKSSGIFFIFLTFQLDVFPVHFKLLTRRDPLRYS